MNKNASFNERLDAVLPHQQDEAASSALREVCRRELRKVRLLSEVLAEDDGLSSRDSLLRNECLYILRSARRRRQARVLTAVAASIVVCVGVVWRVVDRTGPGDRAERSTVPDSSTTTERFERVTAEPRVEVVGSTPTLDFRAAPTPSRFTIVRTSDRPAQLDRLQPGDQLAGPDGYRVAVIRWPHGAEQIMVWSPDEIIYYQ